MIDKVIFFTLLMTFGMASRAQQQTAQLYDVECMRGLTKEEVYERYAYDDSSRALITKFYSSNNQAAVLAVVGSALTVGAGALTYSMNEMVVNGSAGFGVIYLIPLVVGGAGATVFFAAGTFSSILVVQSKKKLLDSLAYYKEKGELKEKDRRWIKSYIPRQ